ncbi:MAG: chromosome segregation protein SMC [Deltaproteobacteria bacterium]|nr:chromosome segregation protein SMC [Deltaproteobacteria bacterium]
MKIKKLSIHGFKSFPDRTHFAFPPGTSAIVGPNGCGKSNIVDAIRWVLGEQNARHLRGKLMEDLVFTGSDSRKPIGMAEVTLTLSNEEGNAPASYANFTEIEVARRVYKSGDSEYFINRVPSRLKDIVELFADTGIGTRAYSIIEQGQVGWLVTAKPEERRAIFEEAAGISKYKHKKDEALRKLEATRTNLTRVSDIIGEVKRQLNSLNRQAKKAERYKELKEELKKLDLHLFHLEHTRMSEEKARIGKESSSLEDSEIKLSSAISAKDGEREGVGLEYLKKEGEYKALREKTYELEKAIQTEERAAELAGVRVEELKRASERLALDIGELKTRKVSLEGETSGLEAEGMRLSGTIGAEKKRLSENETALEGINSTLKEKETALKTEEAASMGLYSKISEIRHSMENCIREEEALRLREAKLGKEIEEAAKAIFEKEPLLKALRQVLSDAVRGKESAGSELDSLIERLKGLESEKTGKTEELKGMNEAFAAKRERLKTLEEMTVGEAGAGGLLSFIRRNGRNGVHGCVADVIETVPGYEKAVEAVLGERLNYVIVESQKEGVEAVEYLKMSSAGRGSFVPVRETRPSGPHGDAASPPAIGADLGDKVMAKDGYGGVIKNLLDGVVVVDDFESALEVWKKNGVSRTFVTPEGEMVDRHGIITGGRTNGHGASGVLQKRREIKELKAEVSATEERLVPIEKRMLELDSSIADTRALVEGFRERLYKGDLERIEGLGAIKRAEDDISRLKEREASLSSESLSATKELVAMGDKKLRLSRERESLEKEAEAKDGLITALSGAGNSLREKKEGMTGVVTDIRVALASAEERFEHTSRLIKEKHSLIHDAEKRIASKEEEIEAGEKETAAMKEETERKKAVLEELLHRKDSLKNNEVLLEEELSALSERMKSSEAEIRKLRDELSGLQEKKAGLSFRLKELELSLGNLKEKTIERYGADMRDYASSVDIASMEPTAASEKADELREKIGAMGEVSLSALEEYRELDERHNFLIEQQADLTASMESLSSAISRINRTTRERFKAAFDEINQKFSETFPRFFNGGRAELRLVGEEDVLESGVDIAAQPPGKKLQHISLLSGGEKALTATALIFSIFLIKPSPFCLLDEVDAPLDDANVDRFNGFVKEMSLVSQFILITHNKRTMEMADTLFGITMEEPGVSKVVAVNI